MSKDEDAHLKETLDSGDIAGAVTEASKDNEDIIKEAKSAAEEDDDESPEAIRRRLARKRREQNSLAGLFLIEAGKNADTLLGLMDKLEQRVTTQGYLQRSTTSFTIQLYCVIH